MQSYGPQTSLPGVYLYSGRHKFHGNMDDTEGTITG
jgi:hypothetical protein